MSGVACEHGNPWDECRVCQIQDAEERGRRCGIEEMKLGTCRVYRHGCADGRAIESHLSDRWREYALPHPKRENCVEWVALAPPDSAPQHKDWCALFGNPEAGKSCDCRGERK